MNQQLVSTTVESHYPVTCRTYRYLLLVVALLAVGLVLAACNATAPANASIAAPASDQTPAATSTVPPALTGEPVRVGILVNQSAVATNQQYSDLMAYLSKATGRPFVIVPLTAGDQLSSVEQKRMEYLFTNSIASVGARRLYGVTFLGTLSRLNSGSEFSGLIITRKDSGIKTVEDLRGKRGACYSFTGSAAAGPFQIFDLLQKSFDPYKDFSSFVEISSQENVVLSVLNGTSDVGFVRTGMLEDMQKAGTLTQSDIDAIEIMNRADDNFFYVHSTALYPEWPFAALAGTDTKLSDTVKAALLAIPPNDPALKSAKITGFVPAADYSSVDALIEALKLPGWNAVPDVTPVAKP